ncbi:hypothetical protein CLG96_12025 [Sphingomonas oleivorans]|uniref:diguanylate cyclase n=1 Tax=Sphingomonas oleivorans TaxID=1735121 RepID=A0A2T5FVT6_9SPHN|nr:diguanylate cyclase [Sphingomonas oleivorans]PTQ09886.1 hypothetical protein CLG96_12025 [Sphingomonas oleivorans]
MAFDPLTLITALILVLCAVGVQMLLLWRRQRRQIPALGWWGAAFLIAALGFILLLGWPAKSTMLGRVLANAIMLFGMGCSYTAARVLNGREARLVPMLAGGLFWLGLCLLLEPPPEIRMATASILSGSYNFITARELWRGALPQLRSQRAAAIACALHGGFFVLRLILGPTLNPGLRWIETAASLWGTVMAIEAIIYVSVFSFLAASMTRERISFDHERAALEDPLTGIGNRRAFDLKAPDIFARDRRLGRCSALLLFDLDHFKRINDTHGHDAGNRLLVHFTETAARLLRQDDLFCRIGGEEFVLVLGNAGAGEARFIAERVRDAFAQSSVQIGDRAIATTVSVGIAEAGPDANLAELLSRADAGLYAAKARGRNRVVNMACIGEPCPQPGEPAVA